MTRWHQKAKANGLELEHHVRTMLEGLTQTKQIQYARLEVNKKKKQPGDFVIVTKYRTWLIDCKETSKNKLYWSQVPYHQIQAAIDYQQLGHKGGFLVWFTELDPCKSNLRFVTDFSHDADISSGIRFEWQNILERRRNKHEIAVELREKGESLRAIANKLGVSHMAVKKWLARYGSKTKKTIIGSNGKSYIGLV